MDSPKTSNVISCVHRFIREITCPLDKLRWLGPFERLATNNIVAFRIPEAPTEGRSPLVELRDGGILDPKALSESGQFILFIIILVQRG